MNQIGCPECDNHDDRDLGRHVEQLIQIGLLLPLLPELGKHPPHAPRQETSEEHIEDRNANEIDRQVKHLALDRGN